MTTLPVWEGEDLNALSIEQLRERHAKLSEELESMRVKFDGSREQFDRMYALALARLSCVVVAGRKMREQAEGMVM